MAGSPSKSDGQQAKLLAKAKSERKRLLARGSKVTLANGAVVNLVFTARSVAEIEDEYGSLEDYTDVLRVATRGRMTRHLAFTLHVLTGVNREEALDLIDLKRLNEYFDAIGAALAEALPEPSEEEMGNALAAMGIKESLGAASSTLQSLSGTSPPATSGT